jgi:hypothetical protein
MPFLLISILFAVYAAPHRAKNFDAQKRWEGSRDLVAGIDYTHYDFSGVYFGIHGSKHCIAFVTVGFFFGNFHSAFYVFIGSALCYHEANVCMCGAAQKRRIQIGGYTQQSQFTISCVHVCRIYF